MIQATLSLYDSVKAGLADLSAENMYPDTIRVTTHVLYPSHGLVRVRVSRLARGLVVTDDGGGYNEARSAGATVPNLSRHVRFILSQYGLRMVDTSVVSPVIAPDNAVGTIILVANASRDVASWLYENTKVKPSRKFRELLSDLLTRRYEGVVSHNAKLIGASRKAHTFPHMLSIRDGRSLVIDTVTNEPSSINARVVANLDVKQTHNDNLEQRIVYDDSERWEPASLSLLGVGAKVVPFSRLDSVLQRLIA